jgi:hypothetical protein
MTFTGTVISVLKKIAWALSAALFVVLVLFVQPLEWLLAVLFVILGLASCVSSLSMWAPIGCFAVMLGLHLFIMFYPIDELERRLGVPERIGTSPPSRSPRAPRGAQNRRVRVAQHIASYRRSLH